MFHKLVGRNSYVLGFFVKSVLLLISIIYVKAEEKSLRTVKFQA